MQRKVNWQIASWIVAVILCATGCEKRRESSHTTFAHDGNAEYVLGVVIDLSGSFSDLMAEKGQAHAFLLQVIDAYFRDRIGSQDKLIIAQISGNERALLWEGKPLQLRRDFPTPESFRNMLRMKSLEWEESGPWLFYI